MTTILQTLGASLLVVTVVGLAVFALLWTMDGTPYFVERRLRERRHKKIDRREHDERQARCPSCHGYPVCWVTGNNSSNGEPVRSDLCRMHDERLMRIIKLERDLLDG